VKHFPTQAINRIMTPLKLDIRGKLTLGFLFAVGCSSHVEVAQGDATGGQSAPHTGGSSANGGNSSTTVGGAFATGGSRVVTGSGGYFCCVATGGSPSNTGGSPPVATGGVATGGANIGGDQATGGANVGGWEATGGTPWAVTGGVGNQATGGAYPGYPNPACTLGADQTCTEDVTVSTLVGQCGADGYCTCNDPNIPNPHSGKCNTYPQTVCYSPTQNIDLAYVSRAFGCHCNSTTPFCGIDSSGLRVYLVCTSGNWQSGDTSNCKS
jgi:hypothetical protein